MEELKELDAYKDVTKDHTEQRFPVMEIFGPTIQGEGAMIGVKTAFVRFGGCDYRCTKCDSLHAVLPDLVKQGATWMTAQEIAEVLIEMKITTGCNWVTLSGGNPVMWELSYLVQLLRKADIGIAVETQGSLWREWLVEVDQLTISPKTPGMGEKFQPKVFEKFLEHIENSYQRMMGHLACCIKLVIFNQTDLEFAVEIDKILDARKLYSKSWWPKADRYLSLGNPFPPMLDQRTGQINTDVTVAIRSGGKTYANLQKYLLDEYKNLLEMDFLQDPRLAHWKFLPQLHVLVWANKAGV